ncbi:MAG: thiamine-phosphate pyrophosphorylase [Candidatus Omnitrophica bacterium]|nr:thiamine-phosphate pyrophosphorylase [Candidatus Omnitrophota bacterium]
MSKNSLKNPVYRVVDANINRAKEGLRVCEDISRFILENRRLTEDFRQVRHKLDSISKIFSEKAFLLRERESALDIGRNIAFGELKRGGIADIFFANLQRAKESARVLEEFAKLRHKQAALKIKKIRYSLYRIEKESGKAISKRLKK